eukprot:2050532-Pyramimonas_sp.AAC.1
MYVRVQVVTGSLDGGAGVTAPTFNSTAPPAKARAGASYVTIEVTLDVAGEVAYVAVPRDDPEPSVAEVRPHPPFDTTPFKCCAGRSI